MDKHPLTKRRNSQKYFRIHMLSMSSENDLGERVCAGDFEGEDAMTFCRDTLPESGSKDPSSVKNRTGWPGMSPASSKKLAASTSTGERKQMVSHAITGVHRRRGASSPSAKGGNLASRLGAEAEGPLDGIHGGVSRNRGVWDGLADPKPAVVGFAPWRGCSSRGRTAGRHESRVSGRFLSLGDDSRSFSEGLITEEGRRGGLRLEYVISRNMAMMWPDAATHCREPHHKTHACITALGDMHEG